MNPLLTFSPVLLGICRYHLNFPQHLSFRSPRVPIIDYPIHNRMEDVSSLIATTHFCDTQTQGRQIPLAAISIFLHKRITFELMRKYSLTWLTTPLYICQAELIVPPPTRPLINITTISGDDFWTHGSVRDKRSMKSLVELIAFARGNEKCKPTKR